jgi:hypothetical protein
VLCLVAMALISFNGNKVSKISEEIAEVEWGTIGDKGGMPKSWGLASPMTTYQVVKGSEKLNFHFSGMVCFKYVHESGSIEDGPVIYRHCNDKQPKLAFRYVGTKVLQVEVHEIVDASYWKLSLTSPLSGHRRTMLTHARASWKSVLKAIYDKVCWPKKYKLTLLDGDSQVIDRRGNSLLKNVLKVPVAVSNASARKLFKQSK